jgi:hypothetical protein
MSHRGVGRSQANLLGLWPEHASRSCRARARPLGFKQETSSSEENKCRNLELY